MFAARADVSVRGRTTRGSGIFMARLFRLLLLLLLMHVCVCVLCAPANVVMCVLCGSQIKPVEIRAQTHSH